MRSQVTLLYYYKSTNTDGEDLAESSQHLATAASHRSSKSRTREKSHDRVRLVELHHAQDDDFGLPRTRGGVGTAQTRGTSAATVCIYIYISIIHTHTHT